MCEYYHIVPWYNSAEWHSVYEKLFGPTTSLQEKEEAVELMLIWKARCPSLPSGVESTLTLLEVYMQDEKNSENDVHEQLLRLAYSSAIMRFVNHMLDTETAKGTSLYKAAKTLGVPDWIIDMRHDTAHHNKLPTIELLRDATAICLDWLRTSYWDKHKVCIKDYVVGQKSTNVISEDENKIAAVMSLLTSLSICSHSRLKIKNLSQVPDNQMQQSMIDNVSELFGHSIDMSNPKTVSIQALISALNGQANKLLRSNETEKYVNNALLGEDSVMLSMELCEYLGSQDFSSKKQLNPHYLQCFEVLLKFLQKNNLLLDLIMDLIKESQNKEDDRCLIAALWVSEILKALRKCNLFCDKIKNVNNEILSKKKTNELKQMFHHWFPSEKLNGLILDLSIATPKQLSNINFIQPIISAYNPSLTYFIKDIINLLEPKLPKVTADKICKLAKLISEPVPEAPVPSKVYTVDDLKMSRDSNPISFDSGNSDSDCEMVSGDETEHYYKIPDKTRSHIWRLSTSNAGWSSCPIGNVPWLVNRTNSH